MAHNVPMEDAQELHVSVVMIIAIVAPVVVVGEGSITGTATQVGVLSVTFILLFPTGGAAGVGSSFSSPLVLLSSWSSFVPLPSMALAVVVAVVVVAVVLMLLLLPPP